MAQEFKEWDRKFSRKQIEEYRRSSGFFNFDQDTVDLCDSYNYADLVDVKQSMDVIRHAVYFADDAEEWQLFRVSLKGLRTAEKIIALENRYEKYCMISKSENEESKIEKARREKIRIDNYLGALIRGGQLSGDYTIKRAI